MKTAHFIAGLLLAAAFVLGGCQSRDQLRDPTEAQRLYDTAVRPAMVMTRLP